MTMKRKPSQIEQEIKNSPELLRLLTAKPELFQKILAASLIAEHFEELTAAYLSGSEEGFIGMSNFLLNREIPVSPVTGEPFTDQDGKYLLPLADPDTGESLYSRFVKWLHGRLVTSQVTWDDEQQILSVPELESLWNLGREKNESGEAS